MSKGTILVVEPDEDIREWIEAALEADDYEVWAMDTADKALEFVDILQPHLLVLDSKHDSYWEYDEAYPLLDTGVPHFLLGREAWAWHLHGLMLDGDTVSPFRGSIVKQAIDDEDRVKLRKATMAYKNRW
jgi:hypothetical protein